MRIVFYSILLGMIAGNLLWWRHAHKAAGSLKRASLWRTFIGVWCGAMFLVIAIMLVARPIAPQILDAIPKPVVAAAYIWNLLFMLVWLAWRLIYYIGLGVKKGIRGKPGPIFEPTLDLPRTSRRKFLAATAIAVPPTLATLAAWRAVQKFDEFRINRVSLAIPNLPPALNGLRIAHVSDLHIGKFTDDVLLRKVAEQTNLLRPDLILFTGDLIDYAIADLPAGLDMVKKWNPKYDVVFCEGNHDLMSGRQAFEWQVMASGVKMPINDSHSVNINGQEVQLLGLRWGGPRGSQDVPGSSDEQIAASVQTLIPQIRPGAFPIALVHHPHAFDYFGDAHVPLTLAGHTHGGQLNFGPIHPGSLRFRYLSGLYEKPGKKMFVSNGVGNWFPLRINAPAEIVDITLRPA